MRSILILALAAVSAHKAVDEDVPDDVLLRGTDDGFDGLDLSLMKNQNYEKDISKYPLQWKFSDDNQKQSRGNLVVTKNKHTQEIMKVELED